jgi:hypothetical protein
MQIERYESPDTVGKILLKDGTYYDCVVREYWYDNMPDTMIEKIKDIFNKPEDNNKKLIIIKQTFDENKWNAPEPIARKICPNCGTDITAIKNENHLGFIKKVVARRWAFLVR